MRTDSEKRVIEQALFGTVETFEDAMRQLVRETMLSMMNDEAESLCGPKYEPRAGKSHLRAGSENGHVYVENNREPVVRPRVRQQIAGGKSQEVKLKSYALAKSRRDWLPKMFQMVNGGMSLRSVEGMDWKGSSDSTVQRHFVKEGAKKLLEFRERDLTGIPFFGISVDGVHFCKGMTGIVAIGFGADGKKMVLDFEVGSSESSEVCKTLLRRVVQRGFQCVTEKLLVSKDDSDALEKAIREVFPKSLIQLCWIHKERNLHAYLSKKHWGECSGLVAKIRHVQGMEAGEKAFDDLYRFIASKNGQSAKNLLEKKESLLTLHRLECPSTLYSTFLSTNCIENVILNIRRKTNRVTCWKKEETVSRWMAFSLLEAEKGFRRIRGWEDIPQLLEKLGNPAAAPSDSVPGEATPSGSSTPSTPSEGRRKTRKT